MDWLMFNLQREAFQLYSGWRQAQQYRKKYINEGQQLLTATEILWRVGWGWKCKLI